MHDPHWSYGVIVEIQSLALTSISFNDLPILYERMRGSEYISKHRLILYKEPLSHKDILKIGNKRAIFCCKL